MCPRSNYPIHIVSYYTILLLGHKVSNYLSKLLYYQSPQAQHCKLVQIINLNKTSLQSNSGWHYVFRFERSARLLLCNIHSRLPRTEVNGHLKKAELFCVYFFSLENILNLTKKQKFYKLITNFKKIFHENHRRNSLAWRNLSFTARDMIYVKYQQFVSISFQFFNIFQRKFM